MSFKTDRLAALFPDVYAARERDSLLHQVLDALGAELVNSDAAVKDLLKSHWIDYVGASGLDGLGALLGVVRRRLPDGIPEGDETFRPLLKSTVLSFIGGGTVEATKGAVRAALGLPYDLGLFAKQIAGPGGAVNRGLANLVAGLDRLVKIEEFSPKTEVVLGSALPTPVGSTTTLDVNFATVEPVCHASSGPLRRMVAGTCRSCDRTRVPASYPGMNCSSVTRLPTRRTPRLLSGTMSAYLPLMETPAEPSMAPASM